MGNKMNLNDLSKDHKKLISKIEKNKNKSMNLTLFCILLLLLELGIDLFMNVNMLITIICTFVFSAIINTYVLYKLEQCKDMVSIIITADKNQMTIEELFKKKRNKNLVFLSVNWRSFLTEYILVILSCFICLNALLISITNHI